MKTFAFKLLLLGVSLSFFYEPALAQQASAPDKKSLITQFRLLTSANNVRMRMNFTVEDIQKELIDLVEKDDELSAPQKLELKKSALEGGARLDKQVKDFFSDQVKMAPISEEVIFQIYDRTFSESELRELVAFYQTTAGKKALEFLPSLSSQYQKAISEVLLPLLQNFIRPKIKSETEQLKQKVADVKSGKSKN